jgi:hypothetical protein
MALIKSIEDRADTKIFIVTRNIQDNPEKQLYESILLSASHDLESTRDQLPEMIRLAGIFS